MSVPVCDATGKLTAVLSSTAPCIQLTRERGDELVPEVMGSATAISGDLRFMHTTDPAITVEVPKLRV